MHSQCYSNIESPYYKLLSPAVVTTKNRLLKVPVPCSRRILTAAHASAAVTLRVLTKQQDGHAVRLTPQEAAPQVFHAMFSQVQSLCIDHTLGATGRPSAVLQLSTCLLTCCLCWQVANCQSFDCRISRSVQMMPSPHVCQPLHEQPRPISLQALHIAVRFCCTSLHISACFGKAQEITDCKPQCKHAADSVYSFPCFLPKLLSHVMCPFSFISLNDVWLMVTCCNISNQSREPSRYAELLPQQPSLHVIGTYTLGTLWLAITLDWYLTAEASSALPGVSCLLRALNMLKLGKQVCARQA